jgi:hypothetical protein
MRVSNDPELGAAGAALSPFFGCSVPPRGGASPNENGFVCAALEVALLVEGPNEKADVVEAAGLVSVFGAPNGDDDAATDVVVPDPGMEKLNPKPAPEGTVVLAGPVDGAVTVICGAVTAAAFCC